MPRGRAAQARAGARRRPRRRLAGRGQALGGRCDRDHTGRVIAFTVRGGARPENDATTYTAGTTAREKMPMNGHRQVIGGTVVALVLEATLLLPPQRAFADQRDFRLVNAGPNTITQVYVWRAGVVCWCGDLLHDDVLPPGRSLALQFGPQADSETCHYDVHIIREDGTRATQSDVDLCTTSTVTFR